MKPTTIVLLVCTTGVIGYYLGVRRQSPYIELSRPLFVRDCFPEIRNVIPVEEHIADKPAVRPPSGPRNSPDSAMRFELESMQRGDIPAVAQSIVLSPEARAVIESAITSAPADLTREYPTPELMAAFVFCGAQRIEGFRIESTTFEGTDRALQRVDFKFESEETWRSEELTFLLELDGWRRVVNLGVAQRVAAIIGVQKQ